MYKVRQESHGQKELASDHQEQLRAMRRLNQVTEQALRNLARDTSATPELVPLSEKLGNVARSEIDHLLRERFIGRQAHRLAHRALTPFGVASAQLRESANVRRRVVGLLLGQGVLRRWCLFG